MPEVRETGGNRTVRFVTNDPKTPCVYSKRCNFPQASKFELTELPCPHRRELRKIGASVRARLLDLSRWEEADFQNLLTRYVLERLLYRLSASAERDRFVLEGAMLFAAGLDHPFRPTGDLDLLGFGDDEVERIADKFRGICAIEASDDGVIFDVDGLPTPE